MGARGLADFMGSYDFTRRIDHAAGGSVEVTGRAVIERSAAGATYREAGRMVLEGGSFDTQQSYLWRGAGARIQVDFPDGRAFHDFDPVHGGMVTEHLCGADTYRGGYDFSQWSCWAVTWDVSGPRKDYRSLTWYVRRPD